MDNYTVEYMPDYGIIKVQIKGEFDAQVLSMATSKLVEEISRHDCSQILMDHRDATSKLPIVDLYNRPEIAASLGIERSNRIAIIYSKEEDDYRFLETVARNKGFMVKIFKDLDEGIKWLNPKKHIQE